MSVQKTENKISKEHHPESPCFACDFIHDIDEWKCIECKKVGFIFSRQGKKDRRQKFYQLTKKGCIKAVSDKLKEEINEILNGCDSRTLQYILELMKEKLERQQR